MVTCSTGSLMYADTLTGCHVDASRLHDGGSALPYLYTPHLYESSISRA